MLEQSKNPKDTTIMSEQSKNPIEKSQNEGKIDTPMKHIHDRSQSCLGTGSSIISGGIKLAFQAQASPNSEYIYMVIVIYALNGSLIVQCQAGQYFNFIHHKKTYNSNHFGLYSNNVIRFCITEKGEGKRLILVLISR